jgi:hypothetical protein
MAIGRNISQEQQMLSQLPDELLEEGLSQSSEQSPFTQFLGAIEMTKRARQRKSAGQALAASQVQGGTVIGRMMAQKEAIGQPQQQFQTQQAPPQGDFSNGGMVPRDRPVGSPGYAQGGLVQTRPEPMSLPEVAQGKANYAMVPPVAKENDSYAQGGKVQPRPKKVTNSRKKPASLPKVHMVNYAHRHEPIDYDTSKPTNYEPRNYAAGGMVDPTGKAQAAMTEEEMRRLQEMQMQAANRGIELPQQAMGMMPGFAAGGMVDPTGKAQAAMTEEEMRRLQAEAQRLGVSGMRMPQQAMGMMPGFAQGGMVQNQAALEEEARMMGLTIEQLVNIKTGKGPATTTPNLPPSMQEVLRATGGQPVRQAPPRQQSRALPFGEPDFPRSVSPDDVAAGRATMNEISGTTMPGYNAGPEFGRMADRPHPVDELVASAKGMFGFGGKDPRPETAPAEPEAAEVIMREQNKQFSDIAEMEGEEPESELARSRRLSNAQALGEMANAFLNTPGDTMRGFGAAAKVGSTTLNQANNSDRVLQMKEQTRRDKAENDRAEVKYAIDKAAQDFITGSANAATRRVEAITDYLTMMVNSLTVDVPGMLEANGNDQEKTNAQLWNMAAAAVDGAIAERVRASGQMVAGAGNQ